MQFAADGGSPIFRAFLPGVGKENLQETPIRLAVKTMVSVVRISLKPSSNNEAQPWDLWYW